MDDKKIKLVIVAPGNRKSEILPRDDGRRAVREFEYDDDGKRTHVGNQIATHEQLAEIVKVDDRFWQGFLEFAREIL